MESAGNNVDDRVLLKPSVKVEPLVARWYAWGHVITPVQHALNLTFKQIPMLRSFVANPKVHEAAWGDPDMLGGPFLEMKSDRVDEVGTLLADTLKRHAPLLEFADALIELHRTLYKTVQGHSLDRCYETLPKPLLGLVELTYDVGHQPTIRVLDEVAYELKDNSAGGQSIAFSESSDDSRRFFLNTPRLDEGNNYSVPIRFDSPGFDLLAKCRIRPVRFGDIVAAFGIPTDDVPRFREFFTRESLPQRSPRNLGQGVRARYFGHACVLVQTAEVSILVDPFVAWDSDIDERLSFYDLPDHIDYVFISHNHQDHFCPELLLQLRGRVGKFLVARNNCNSIADPSMKLSLAALGFKNVETMDPMDEIEFAGGKLVSLPFFGEHADLNIASKHALLLEVLGTRFVFVADSDCKDGMLYRRIIDRIGGADVAFIGMECNGAPLSWLYSAYLPNSVNRKDDDSRRLSGSDCARALEMVEAFGCSSVYIYGMGQEPWLRFVAGLEYDASSVQITESDALVKICRERGIRAERLYGCKSIHVEGGRVIDEKPEVSAAI